MESIQAIYDGYTFKPLEQIPVQGRYEVKIIFEKPLEAEERVKAITDKLDKAAASITNDNGELKIDKREAVEALRGILAGVEPRQERTWEEKVERFKAFADKMATAAAGIEIDLDKEREERINRKR